MPISKEERVHELARLAGVPLPDDMAAEVGDRLASLLREMERITALDLSAVEPVVIFPEEPSDGA